MRPRQPLPQTSETPDERKLQYQFSSTFIPTTKLPPLERPAAFAIPARTQISLSTRRYGASHNLSAGDHMIASREREVVRPQFGKRPLPCISADMLIWPIRVALHHAQPWVAGDAEKNRIRPQNVAVNSG